MASSFEAFKRSLEAAFEKRGARAEFVRRTGIAQAVIQRWLNQEGEPNLSSVDRAAAGLGVAPWELLKPEGTHERTLADRIDELKAAVTAPSAPTPAHAELFRIASTLNEHQLNTLLEVAKGFGEIDADPEQLEPLTKPRKRR